MSGINLTGGELFLGGAVMFAVLVIVIKVRAGLRRARTAIEVARVGTTATSLIGRALATAGVIAVGQWLVITYASSNTTLLWVVLGVPALISAYALTKTLTVTEIRPNPRKGGGRR